MHHEKEGRNKLMKYLFLVNPAAGKGSQKGRRSAEKNLARMEVFIRQIRQTAEKLGGEARIEQTEGTGDAERKAADFAARTKGEPARIYACGGDGTLNEVINGVYGFPDVEIGVFPIGTGNDTVRNFRDPSGHPIRKEEFLNPEKQMLGKTQAVDLLRYEGVLNGRFQTRYCINMLNNGFDCNVVACAGRLKKKRFISGSVAYLIAVFLMFVKKQGIRLVVEGDGQVLSRGNVLLCAAANGCYCGGGIKGLPMAVMNDGKIELSILKNMKRRTFLRLLPRYADGTYLSDPQADRLVIRGKFSRVSLLPDGEESFFTCADGEITETTGIQIEAVPGGIRFIVPETAAAEEK